MIKILDTEGIRAADRYTIEHEPVLPIDLMERAAGACIAPLQKLIPSAATVRLFCGPGNNGGDGLAIARTLLEKGIQVIVYGFGEAPGLSADRITNTDRFRSLSDAVFVDVKSAEDLPRSGKGEVWVDALFGTGLGKPVTGIFLTAIQRINSSEALVVAIDIPSGLPADRPAPDAAAIVQAHHTLTFQFPKLSFLLPSTGRYVGKWEVLDIGLHPAYIVKAAALGYLVTSEDISLRYRKRDRFSHKGTHGHAVLLAGSYGKSGAALLATRACLRSGAGLLTVHVPRESVEILQVGAPEAMVSVDSGDRFLTGTPDDLKRFNAVGIGPGLGTRPETAKSVEGVLRSGIPVVLDADALNLISEHPNLAALLHGGCILTPHPKEFERLAGPSRNDFERIDMLRAFAVRHGVTVVLKGAYTCTMTAAGEAYFNATGNAGLAKGGSGDILTGMVLALLAQGYSIPDAAMIAVHVHGEAADKVRERLSMQGMLPSDVVEQLPASFRTFEQG